MNKLKFLKHKLKSYVNSFLSLLGVQVVRTGETVDYCLYEYDSYEEYRNIQVAFNKKKLDHVWADEHTLDRVGQILLNEFKDASEINGLCHGARNGFEQKC